MKSFEERLNRLEELNDKIADGEIPLDEAVSFFEEGIKLAKGLEKDTIRRKELIHKKVPGMLRKSFESFAGTEGTKRFESFTNGKFEYWSFVLAKN